MNRSTSSFISIEPTLETVRFGPIQIVKENMLNFPEGMIGFADLKQYILLAHGDQKNSFFWLQSIDDLSLAFPVVDPSLFTRDYKIQIPIQDMASVQLTDEKQAEVLVVATIPPGEKKELWLNLQAPVVINKSKRLAKQIILDADDYPLRFKVVL